MSAAVTVNVTRPVRTVDVKAELTLLGRGGETIVLPITDPKATYDNLAANWVEVPRPGLKPYNKRVGDNLHTLAVNVTIVGSDNGPRDPAGTCDHIVRQLLDMTANDTPDAPVALTWGTLDSASTLTQTGHWHVQSMTITGVWKQPGTNNISQATAAITLKEASDEPTTPNAQPTWLAPPPPPSPVTVSATVPRIRVYNVVQGDTAYSIAKKVYGSSEPGWRTILAANGLTDPRNLTPGMALLIP
jgi:LysM repeat protein